MKNKVWIYKIILCLALFRFVPGCIAQSAKPDFKVIAFFTSRNDLAHISFVHEANRWFPQAAAKHNFVYDSTNNWDNLNEAFLSQYQVVIFLDTRPDKQEQRDAFKKYMDNGGAWMGFHFAGFALTPSEFPQNWNWYHNQFIGSGQYKGNTWRPTSAFLKVEHPEHPVTKGLGPVFKSAKSEWYSWERDIRKNDSITILLSIDPSSFPLGTGPKLHEIWHEGYYPVVWTNKYYHMLYLNMGHNDIDYENKTNKELSSQFESEAQNKLVIQGLLWLGNPKGHSNVK